MKLKKQEFWNKREWKQSETVADFELPCAFLYTLSSPAIATGLVLTSGNTITLTFALLDCPLLSVTLRLNTYVPLVRLDKCRTGLS